MHLDVRPQIVFVLFLFIAKKMNAVEMIDASLDPQTQSEYFTIIFLFFQLTYAIKHLKPIEFTTLNYFIREIAVILCFRINSSKLLLAFVREPWQLWHMA